MRTQDRDGSLIVYVGCYTTPDRNGSSVEERVGVPVSIRAALTETVPPTPARLRGTGVIPCEAP